MILFLRRIAIGIPVGLLTFFLLRQWGGNPFWQGILGGLIVSAVLMAVGKLEERRKARTLLR
jgi:hypothetical protein